MSEPTPIVMYGAAGRMGRMILDLAAQDPVRYRIAGAVEYAAHPLIGQSLATLVPGAPADVLIQPTAPGALPADAVAIDYSSPESTLSHVDAWRAASMPVVIGTTGFTEAEKVRIQHLSQAVPVLLTPNTSTGVNVLFWLVRQATRLLGPDYDIEITEMHHHHKKDAPSGTARRLAEVAVEERQGSYERDVRHGRVGQVGARIPSEIGMHALRGGDVVGEHTVTLAGPGERIELTHRAHTRATFAGGALRAAAWLRGRPAGAYSMNDVLGLQ